MKQIFLSCFIILVLFSACQKYTEFTIESFDAQNEFSKSHIGTKSIYYLVEGYNGHDSDYEQIDNHVCELNRDSLARIYSQFWINYYRKSEKTNNSNIFQYPKDFFNFSTFEDRIAEYTFFSDSIVLRRKYFLQEYERNTDFFRNNDLCK